MEVQTLGENVKRLRKYHKLKQDELGALIGKRHGHISQIENGKLIPGVDILVDLARALQTTTDYLLGVDEARNGELDAIMELLAELDMESVMQFLAELQTLPAWEQRYIARLVKLSAQNYKLSGARNLFAPADNNHQPKPQQNVEGEANAK